MKPNLGALLREYKNLALNESVNPTRARVLANLLTYTPNNPNVLCKNQANTHTHTHLAGELSVNAGSLAEPSVIVRLLISLQNVANQVIWN